MRRAGGLLGWAAAAFLSLFGAAAAQGQQGAAALRSLERMAPPLLDALARQAAYCLGREDTDHPVFRGCVDWHSSAHAAWALMAHARATGSDGRLPLLRRLMTPKGLAAEARYLRAEPGFETPYGRAWFLRLALEREALARTGADAPPDVSAMADEIAQGLIAYFETRLRRDGGFAPHRGSYDSQSWALFNLLAYLRARRAAPEAAAWAPQALRQVEDWTWAGFVEADPRCPASLSRQGFMAICANWAALAVSVQPKEAARVWADRFFKLNPIPAPMTDPAHPHHYGLNFSRAWAYWTLWEATEDPRFANAYAAHIVAGAPEENWAGRYIVNGHWVAQFGIFALQPLFTPRAEAALTRS